jgi:alpha-galactosidase
VLLVDVGAPAKVLRAVIGLDRNVDGTAASVRFRVVVNNADAYASPILRAGAAPIPIEVPLSGASAFDLVVEDGGDGRGWDQGDWADARVTLQSGVTLRLDDLARRTVLPAFLPFSFVYGGRPSADLLPRWQRKVAVSREGTSELRTVTLTDPGTGLQVRADARIMLDTPGVDWTVRFRNTGKKRTPPIERIRASRLEAELGIGAEPVLHRLRGSAQGALSWQPVSEPIKRGATTRMASANGRTAGQVGPFFTVDWGDGGIVTGIGWSGQWEASVTRTDAGMLEVEAGFQDVRVCLEPGEEIRSPRILQVVYTDGNADRAHDAFRRTMLAHVLPRIGGEPVTPPIAHLSTSFYELNDTNEANLMSHLRSLDGLGFEVFWLDAYWTRGGFPAGMGNYALPLSAVEPKDRFPHGLGPIAEAVRKAGMGFLMWFEPERVAPGTTIAREHPEWVLSPAGDGSGLLDLGNAQAREHMRAYLSAAIREYGLAWLRIDYNIDPLAYWRHGDRGDAERAGMTEIRYVEGLYRLWDDLRREFPSLAIDNCASGGQRIDLETCSRSIPLWRTDDTIDPLMRLDFDEAAIRNQLMTAGLGRYVPFSVSGQMGSTPYHFRSGLNAGIAFAEDVRPKTYPRARLARAVAEARRLRPYFSGDLTVLAGADADPAGWSVLQYDRPEHGDGMVMAFRRHASPFSAFEARLRGVDAKATYTVRRSPGFVRGKAETMLGADLAKLQIAIGERPGSVVIEYSRLGSRAAKRP